MTDDIKEVRGMLSECRKSLGICMNKLQEKELNEKEYKKVLGVLQKIRVRAKKLHAFCGAYDRTAEDIRKILKELD